MYQFNDILAGSGGGTALLSMDAALGRPLKPVSFGRRMATPHAAQKNFSLVVDLSERIGSPEWLRGVATCAALCCAAYALSPGWTPIPGAAAAPLPEAHWEQARALSFSPLALGADTGRRMAPTEAVVPLMEAPERPSVDLVATFGRGDGFGRMLERAGLGPAEAGEVAALVGQIVPLSDIRAGTRINIRLGRRPNQSVARPLESLAFRARFDLSLALERVGGRLSLSQIPISVDATPLRIQGRVGSSLYRSARAAGAPARAIEAYIRAIASQVGIGQIGEDDRFDIILEHRRAATGETESGQLLFAGLQRERGRNLQLMQWSSDGRTQWFEASGVGRQSGIMQQPVPGAVTSNFGLRMHPVLGYARMHRGLDFRASYGTPIVAATDGRVVAAGWGGGYGRIVRLNHAANLSTVYAHMSRIAVQPGQAVRAGQVIGYVGSTGLSTGPHLHYELYRNGVPINPRSVRFVTRSLLSGADLEGFRSRLRSLLNVPVGASRVQQASGPGAVTAPLAP